MAKLSLITQVEMQLKPIDVATLFCNMDGNEQADFFNQIALIARDWKNPFCFQLQAIIDANVLTEEGRHIMAEIGQYSTHDTGENLAIIPYYNVAMICDGKPIDEFKSTNPRINVGNTFMLQKIRDGKLVDIRYLVDEINTNGNDIIVVCSEIPKDS